MSELLYTQDHEWVRTVSDDTVEIGITDFAQNQLGDIVFIELPEMDSEVDAHEEVSVIESVKAAAELKTPVSGTIVEVNEELEDQPELVNSSPTEEGWFCRMQLSNPDELEELMNEEEYGDYVAGLE